MSETMTMIKTETYKDDSDFFSVSVTDGEEVEVLCGTDALLFGSKKPEDVKTMLLDLSTLILAAAEGIEE